jgi:hypothetical protein
MKCDFCGELLTSGRHPMTESGARDVTQCQLVWLLHRNTELESRLDSVAAALRNLDISDLSADQYRSIAAIRDSLVERQEIK